MGVFYLERQNYKIHNLLKHTSKYHDEVRHVNDRPHDDGIFIHRSARISQIFDLYAEKYELQDYSKPDNHYDGLPNIELGKLLIL